MIITLRRIDYDEDSTTGYMKIDGQFECYTLEDEARSIKVPGETCIPPGTYRLRLREVESPMTIKYRNKFDWFNFHIQVMDVPGFEYVYIHIGNTDDDTDGCILVGDSVVNKGSIEDFLGNSTQAFKRFYKKVEPTLDWGREAVTLHVCNPERVDVSEI
jgi:hypothetical protein